MKKRLKIESLEQRRLLTADAMTSEPADEVLEGDLDADGHVGFKDFLLLARHIGVKNALPEMGDINEDGEVTFADFLMLAKNFNRGKSAEAPHGKSDEAPHGKPDDVPRGPMEGEHGKPDDVPRGEKPEDVPRGEKPEDVPRGPKEDADDQEPDGDQGAGDPGDVQALAEEVDSDDSSDDGEDTDDDGGKPDDVPRGEKPDDVPRGEKPDDVPRGEKPDDVPRGERPDDVGGEGVGPIAEIELCVHEEEQRIVITSNKDISNVVYAVDGVFTKIEDVDGTEYILEGLDITDVWVKSGNNASGDGPGYGEHFEI